MSSSFLEHPLALALPERMTDESAWTEHLPFGMTLVALHRPRSIVELGTHRGDSYCAFCQAVRSLALPSRCLAVDTWEGDPQTGFYGPEVLEELRAHHDPRYGDFSRLLRATFDEALAEVPDGSVDLLHVDGLHEHAAVRHDWEAWAPKLSERAVVLFHDTAERGEGFGVHHLWRELAERYPSFELLHGHGLGVLGVGERIDPAVRSLFEADEALAARVRATFMRLGRSLSRDVALRRARAEREEARRRAEAAERENEALAARADQLESARGELESARDELEAVREAGERTAEALREARERAASAEARVEAQQRASRETEEALDAARAAVAQLQAEQGRLQQAVLEAREGAEAEAARAREGAEAEAARAREAASERVRSVEAALAEREARLEVLEAAVDDARAAEAARASELERREALHAVAIEEARGHAAEAEAARDALLTQIEGERAEAARARGELEAERDALRAELERLGRADEALRENARRAHAVTRELELLREDRARVETSVGFRLVSLQRRVMDRLLPVGTRRRAPYVQASSMVGRWLRRPGARPEAPPPTPPPAVPPPPAPVPDETGPREPASDEAPPGDAASPAPTSPLVALVRAPIEASVSVVIPTKNGEAEGVGRCLKALRTQAGLRQPPELVVVDSGSTDRTRELAADAGARVMEIAPEDFDHGGTRNLGADHARGDVILFTVQDAVAASETLVADLVAMLLEDGDLAVVSARQIPRADADHFAAWQLWHHYRVLGDETRLTSAAQAARLAELRGEGLWRAALVDDVCAAHRADAFRALRYRPMRFGEDVDYGLRCLRAGRGLGFYADSGVIHSHRRSAAYQLRSHYVVRETLAPLLEPPDGARFAAAGVRRFDDLRASGLDAYRRLARAASTLAPDRPHDPRRALATLATRLRARDGAAPSPAEGDASLDALLPEVVNGVGSVDPGRASPLVRDAVADALEQLALPFLAPCFERMDGAEIAGFAYKTYGMVFGGALGDWSRSAPDAERAALEALDERLVAGVVR